MSSKRNALSILEKEEILKKFDLLPKCGQRDAALKIGIPQTTLSKILRHREEIEGGAPSNSNLCRKRKRDGKNLRVEEALLKWFENARSMNAPIDRSILFEKSTQLAQKLGVEDFQPTDGWLTRWKQRNNIVYKKLHGEKLDADEPAAENWIRNVLPGLISDYEPDKIFNCDETGLYYRAMPDYTLLFKNAPASAGKKQKDRLTILLTCNMTGTIKQRPLVIGKSKNPRCFRGIQNLPVDYLANKNAWMTSQIFTDFINKWDRQLRIRSEKIILFIDNCAAHPKLTPRNIKLVFMPPNTTSIIQPLDQGIIKTFKTLYRKDMRQTIINAIDDGANSAGDVAKKINILEAIHMVNNAWTNVTQTAISNCFKKAGFSSQGDEVQVPREEDVVDATLDDWVNLDQDIEVMQEVTDEDIINEITGGDEEEEEDQGQEDIMQAPTVKDIRQSLSILRRAIELKNGTKQNYQNFYILSNDVNKLITDSSKQASIDAYFKK